MNLKLISIVTPAYNRAKLLPRLFESLNNQENFNFKWYIIDDGSSDNTQEVVKKFNSENFEIQYIKKENGGKHTAINSALDVVTEPLIFIVDSDDYLVSSATNIIEQDYDRIKDDENICGIGYLRCYNNMQNIGVCYTQDGIIESFIEQRINKNTYGDKAEVFKTKIFKQYRFPVFKGENFVSEATIWCDMALKYKMQFFNKKIYICEYQEGGLSDGVHKRLFFNPNGAISCYLNMSRKPVKIKYRVKYTIAFSVYAFKAKMKLKEQFKKANSKFIFVCTFIFAFIIFKNKQRKYK